MTDLLAHVLTVNGERHEVAAPSSATLLSVLREQLDLTGTKLNCEQGECGACTVLLDGRPANACLVLAASVSGREVTTIEGIGRGATSALQEAFMASDAAHCGYCTPGMVVSAAALLARTPEPSRADIEEAVSGNYCRCTGYDAIVQAIQRAARTRTRE